jgi:C4-dicarboxylate-specific signal transduction histidine kinase
MLLAYVLDATIECWRRGGSDSRPKALLVGLGIAGPLMIAWIVWQVGVLRLAGIPMVYTPIFTITLLVVAFELSRAAALSRKSQLEIAELRAELARAGRISALGQLASGLAHELRQPLGAILNNAEAAEIHLNSRNPDLAELRSIVSDIRNADIRASTIIDGMRTLIVRRDIEMQPLAPAELVQDVISLVHAEATSRRVALSCLLEPDLPPVLGNRVQLSQVLLNLVTNGIEAVQPCPTNARSVAIEGRTQGEQVEIAVRDSGPGIPAESINHVFEPLFSTKSDGMGMGLAICRSIIDAHNGRIWAEHGADGHGAAFRFALPRVHELQPAAARSSLDESSVRRIAQHHAT